MKGDALNPTERAVFAYLRRNPCDAKSVKDIALGLERLTERVWLPQNVRRACYELWRNDKINVARGDYGHNGRSLCFYYFDPEECK
jgi:hypothetical protein